MLAYQCPNCKTIMDAKTFIANEVDVPCQCGANGVHAYQPTQVPDIKFVGSASCPLCVAGDIPVPLATALNVKRIDMRCCPGCGHMASQLEIEMAVLNFPCPHCGEYTYAQYAPLKPR